MIKLTHKSFEKLNELYKHVKESILLFAIFGIWVGWVTANIILLNEKYQNQQTVIEKQSRLISYLFKLKELDVDNMLQQHAKKESVSLNYN